MTEPLDAMTWHHPRIAAHVTVHVATTDHLTALDWIRPTTGDQTGAVALLAQAVAHRFGATTQEVTLHPAVGHTDPQQARPAFAMLTRAHPVQAGNQSTRLWTSLSRNGPWVAVATALTPVGIDLEVLQTPQQATDLLTILHPTDRHQLKSLGTWARTHEVTAAWTRKEALLKALGTGLSRDPALDQVGTLARPVQPAGWVSLAAPLHRMYLPQHHVRADYYLGLAWREEQSPA